MVMTREQFSQLEQLIASNHADSKRTLKLLHAAAGIDRCHVLTLKHVKVWIPALDGGRKDWAESSLPSKSQEWANNSEYGILLFYYLC